MDKYEYKLKTEQMLELMENGAYNRAAEIADAIDWKRVRNATMLTNVSDIYEKNGDYQKSYEVLNIAYHRAEGSRKVLYRLCTLALKTGNVDEAIDYYDDFMQVAPKDPNQHILKYKILRARRAPIEQQIEALEEFKKAEYLEEWAFELAKLYQEAGMTAECLEECDDLILWFSEGKFVYKAMELKMQYKQLTPSQKERYDHRYERLESETEEIPDLSEYQLRNAEKESSLADREELDKEREREALRNRVSGDESSREDSEEELSQEDDVPEEEPGNSEETQTADEAEETEEPEPEEETEVDETVKKLEEKGIGSRMKLEDALKSLLHPKTEEADEEEEDPEDDEMEEDIPELEAAIEEIENVIDLELVNEITGRPEKEGIRSDSDLEELKAEPLDESPDDDGEIGTTSEDDEELEDIPDEILEEIEEVQGRILGSDGDTQEEYTEYGEEISEEDIEDAGAFPEEYLEYEEELPEEDSEELVDSDEDEENIEEYSEEEYSEEIVDSEEEDYSREEEDYSEDEEELTEEYIEEIEEMEEAGTYSEDYPEEDYPEYEEELPEEYSEEIEDADEAEEYSEEIEGADEAEAYSEDIEDADEAEEYSEEIEDADEAEACSEEIEDKEESEEYSEEIEDTEEPEEYSDEIEDVDEPEDSEEAELYQEEEEELPEVYLEEMEASQESESYLEDYPEEEPTEEAESHSGSEAIEADEGIEDAETAENIKPESKKPAEEDQIDGQLSIEDILNDLKDESAEEVDMGDKKKKAEPILPPDIQRMIDEIEGVLPEEPEPEPVRLSRRRAEERRENMGEITQQLRIDDIADYLAATNDGTYVDDLPEEVDEYGNGYEDEYPEEVADEYADVEYAAGYEDEYAEEYTDEYEGENAQEAADEYEDDYAEEAAGEYEDDYAEEEYTGEYEDEYAEEEYTGEYEDDYAEEAADEYEDEYAEEEYADEYEDEYAEEDYAGEDEYEDAEYADDEYDAADGYEEDYGDIEASFEEEFRPNPKHANEPDDREIPDEDDGIDILSATTPLSRKETAKLIATGKTSPLPLDEISDALSLSDTGFVVHGRYDLAAQSGIGTRAGLTDEQKKLFSYFVPVRGMSEQLVDVLEQDSNCTNRGGTSRTGNLLIIGNKGNGKTVLAVDVVKAIQKQRNIRQGKVAIVTGDSLNKKKIGDIFAKLYGGALIIEKASKMNEKTVARLNKAMERDTGEMLIVLEEQRKPLDRLLSSNREFRRKFTSRLEVPIFINDELVTFGQTYAQENGYRIDEMGILALYSKIDTLQREDHAVTVAEVKEVMDEAMAHSQKASAKKLVKRVFGKNTDDADRIILSEKDFNI